MKTKNRIFFLIIILLAFSFYYYLIAINYLKNNQIEKKINNTKNELKIINNPHNFKYILNPGYKICGGHGENNVTLLAMIPISPHNFLNRIIIRTTWSNRHVSPHLRHVFIIGNTNNKTINEKLRQEYDQYEDIVQQDFLDTYKNLTIKTISAIKWASKYCLNTKYVLKIDDDMIINSPRLINYLEKNENNSLPTNNTFLCNPLWKSEVFKLYFKIRQFSSVAPLKLLGAFTKKSIRSSVFFRRRNIFAVFY